MTFCCSAQPDLPLPFQGPANPNLPQENSGVRTQNPEPRTQNRKKPRKKPREKPRSETPKLAPSPNPLLLPIWSQRSAYLIYRNTSYTSYTSCTSSQATPLYLRTCPLHTETLPILSLYLNMSDDELDQEWKPSKARPQSTMARSFSLALNDLFKIDNSLADLDAAVSEKYDPVFPRDHCLTAT
jgi:hypothetical protein